MALRATPGAVIAAGQYVFTVSVSAPNMRNGAQTVTIVLTVTYGLWSQSLA